jgi:hypothetical protein
MNERIKELAKQALKLVADDITKGDVSRLNTDSYHVKDLINEKFAELIVRECLGCCEQVISDPVPKSVDTWLNGGKQCIQEIKEHFGMGMSIEDKKRLIRDLLGVNRET